MKNWNNHWFIDDSLSNGKYKRTGIVAFLVEITADIFVCVL